MVNFVLSLACINCWETRKLKILNNIKNWSFTDFLLSATEKIQLRRQFLGNK